MRLLFVASVASFVAAAGVFACSGTETAAPADAGKDAKAVAKTTDDDDDKQNENTDPPPVVTSDAGDPDATTDASGTPGGDLTTTGDGGIACDTDAFREAETNNDPATANKLTVKIGSTKVCGQVTAADPDFITFKMPDDATGWFVQPKGAIKISGTIDGQQFNGTNFGGIQANQGATWVVKVEPNGGGDTAKAWQLRFDFNQ